MLKTKYPPPTHWEDRVGLVLGLWLLVSPWVLQYGETTAAQNAVLVGFSLMMIEALALANFVIWEEGFSGIIGVWLVVSPWVLGTTLVPMVNFMIVGILVLALAVYVIWDESRHFGHPV